jgi:hypothetical protein
VGKKKFFNNELYIHVQSFRIPIRPQPPGLGLRPNFGKLFIVYFILFSDENSDSPARVCLQNLYPGKGATGIL